MSELTIRLKLGDFEMELIGDKETVKHEFHELKLNGLGKIFESFPNEKPANKQSNPISHHQKPAPPQPEKEQLNKEKKSSPSKSRNTSSKSYKLITDLNLKPKGETSLVDFYKTFVVKNNMERNIVILYYLRRILKMENIGVNHIYTCYKEVGSKIPNLYQSLLDTKNRKGWVDTNNTEDLKVTIQGENYIEHDAPKKVDE